MYFAHIKNNRVVNIIVAENLQILEIHPEANISIFEEYNKEIHPWGPPTGHLDVEVGLGWKTRLKEKLGHCIFCGDHLPETENTGSL